MVNMAEAEPAAMFLTASHHRLQSLDVDMTSDADSEPDEAPSLLMMRSFHPTSGELKRNKRKNFQPRNISYEDPEVFRRSRDSSGDSGDEGEALDLSNADAVPSGNKRFRKTLLAPPAKRFEERNDHENAPVPMDLSCGKSHSDYPDESVHSETESNSEDSERTESSSKREFQQASPHQYLLHHAFLNQPQDASDLKEYAQNTVKELLEIYGLNSAEVAESITNNVPISNFNSGKILESLSARAMGLRMGGPAGPTSPGSQPPTPPRTPLSPHKAASSPGPRPQGTAGPKPTASAVETMAAKFAGLASNNNSRLSLPQNMATILALAAMQDRQGPKTPASGTSTPSTSNNESPASLTGTPRMPLSPSSVRDPSKVSAPVDYSRYVRRFSSALECNNTYCKDLNYREHFHCLDCNSRVFVKKEEMIRHFKWHKKRDESLQHGFMRYSPSDDCSDRYHNCTHNRKQTHYHCIQGTCDKVYISTSDVQMHANYHRKDSAIIQEGFQRLRATEECRTPYCAFFGQRTTHFHCRREHCQFTFKNKADMEKHKTYHIKDEQLARDGFKKFLKPDICGFPNCRFSQVCNHIHCVRDGCSYVLHSSGQLLSHKRKHERKDSEIAYRKFKLAQQAVVNLANSEHLAQHGDSTSSLQLLQQASSLAALTALHDSNFSNSSSEGRSSPTRVPRTPQPPGASLHSPASALDLSSEEGSDSWAHHPTGLCPAGPKCGLFQTDHYHCKEPNCDMPFRCRESAEGHAKIHEAQDRVSDNFYQGSPATCQENCPRDLHFHCTWEGCNDAVLPNERFDHFRNHEVTASQNNSLDALFRRKRGRPPKNRVIEVWNDYAGGMGSDSPQAIFTSFKLPKPAGVPPAVGLGLAPSGPDTLDPRTPSPAEAPARPSLQMLEMHGFQAYNDGCPDPLCLYSAKPLHYHCSRQRCFFATDSEEQLLAHSKDFHDNIEILDGFLFFDRSVDCRLESCVSNKVNRHFHCVRPGCGYSFVRYSSMSLHQAKHLAENSGGMSCGGDTTLDLSSNDNREQHIYPPQHLQHQAQNQHQLAGSPIKEHPQSQTPTGQSTPGMLTSALQPPENGSAARTTEVAVKSEPQSEPHALPEWMSVERHERYGPELSCSRPFCKLKRKEHYHCNACNQAFSELERLRPHIAKHSPSAIPPIMVKQEHNNNEEGEEHPHPALGMMPMNLESGELLPPPPPPHYPGFGAAMAAAVAANQQLAMMTSQGIPFLPHGMPALYTSPSGLMFTAHPGFSPHHAALMGNGLLESARASMGLGAGDHSAADSLLARSLPSPHRDMSPETKKVRVQTSMRILKDEPVPEGYVRFRFNEDCRYNHCGYREHQTHFHCMRKDCGYSFCDKTRFVQHTARHERLDTLMGGDFQQYRANVSCGRPECVYTATLGTVQNKASHFHCLKCDFVCTDTNKVVAHRRHHQKLDSIMAAGFEKFTPTQPCSAPETCIHSKKQTHYHCLSCQYAVLGLSQMTAHKYRHLE
ncbi:zinc finger protein castor homolog 1-like isoform X2 [Macrosteles quadrilineatus]|uniref:zinc finger protein castor homolog 1-like isoform X2 n=1 Tax=Macrosteles quadrilineatus TaxID=74068 RepID=UPI0023E0B3F5|nr:zinc finger protein castor homolog 1-like isoform X2 [Macrosteles quadrilineatus]